MAGSTTGLGRGFDIFVALVVLAAGAPLWLLIALVIRLTSSGPALHRSTRCGLGGIPFTLLKFRSMRVSDAGPGVTASGDPRITSIGRVLRMTKLDEIPQLVNVLRGEMSIIGPRPEDPRFVDGTSTLHRRVLAVRPGLTSAASVAFRHEESLLAQADDLDHTYRTLVLPEKLRIDAAWLTTRSKWSDLRLLGSTIAAISRRSTVE